MGDTLFIVEEGRAGIIAVTATKFFPIEVTTFASFLTRPRGFTSILFYLLLFVREALFSEFNILLPLLLELLVFEVDGISLVGQTKAGIGEVTYTPHHSQVRCR
ncbi:hypothetical protein OZ401_005055 (plasmid) [Candidatus Chlorohelix allophototropha]|uniref:Cyclic nucleotide-binding domain-containing protein n=1 Tax=Candidatus Chlorohelix allophototropha TaxID=3003348 RepID=A0ABY9BAV6_9CHLR|nr:hypothetical protein OZ401_005055 [Chloroflexota bacterium L227-S17]